jgi:pimeloyl-ACP methyl ester carboxylesterase
MTRDAPHAALPNRRDVLAGLAAVLALGGCAGIAEQREERIEAKTPPVGRIIRVNGRKVHVWVAGQGPDLVLIHGGASNLRDPVDVLAPRLTDRYRVIAFDRPGHGYTDRTSPAYEGVNNTKGESPAQQATLLRAAARTFGVDRPIVLGHSVGASVALAWALATPDAAAALVLLSGAAMPYEGALPAYYQVSASEIGNRRAVPLITALTPPKYVEIALGRAFAPQTPPQSFLDNSGVDLALRQETIRAGTQQVRDLPGHLAGMAKRYDSLYLPVEILYGDQDQILPPDLQSVPLAKALANARLTRLPGVGHMPHYARTARVVDAIDRAALHAGVK